MTILPYQLYACVHYINLFRNIHLSILLFLLLVLLFTGSSSSSFSSLASGLFCSISFVAKFSDSGIGVFSKLGSIGFSYFTLVIKLANPTTCKLSLVKPLGPMKFNNRDNSLDLVVVYLIHFPELGS